MNNDNKLHKLSIGVITAMGLLATPQVFAQEEAEDGAEPVEKISIVGSRIRTDEFANDTPIDIISVEDAEQEGLKTLGELLRTSFDKLELLTSGVLLLGLDVDSLLPGQMISVITHLAKRF